MGEPSTPRRLSPLGAAAAVVGLALFAWTVREAGVSAVVDGVRRVGWGFLVIVGLAGLRFLVRAWAWTLCSDAAPPLRIRDTFPAMVAGDTLGNLTPLGLILSEPAKAAFVRPRVTLMQALASITLENIFYTETVAVVIAAGTVALLFVFDVHDALRQASVAGLLLMIVVLAVGTVVLTRRLTIAGTALAWLDRRKWLPGPVAGRLGKLATLEDQVVGFASRHPGRVIPILGVEALFHALGVVEVWITLGLLLGAAAPTLLTTFLLEAVNRTITVAFKFVPLRLGVDEAGTEIVTRTLGLPTGVGVTMAIVRKVRMLFWAGVGVALLARRATPRDGPPSPSAS